MTENTGDAVKANGAQVQSVLTCQCANTITDPCIICGKGKTLVTAEWLQKMAAKEDGMEVGAGLSPIMAMTDAEIVQWVDACNHAPARETLRDYIRLRAALSTKEPSE